jgi:hypothetical protein
VVEARNAIDDRRNNSRPADLRWRDRALLVALVVVVSKMPNTNPLKRILTALCYRLAATLAAGAVAIPLEPIPGIDLLYDIGVPIVLIWYWFTFFRDARRTTSDPSPPIERQVTYGGR